MKKYLMMFLCAAACVCGADEQEVKFDKVTDWLPAKGVTQIKDGLRVENRMLLQSKNFIDIVPGKVYKLKAKVKCVSGSKTTVYFGFNMYQANGKVINNQNVNAIGGTLATVAVDAKKGDTALVLGADGSKWRPLSYSFLALNAKKDYSDLPNFNVVQFPIKSIEKCEEGYKILLSGKLSRDIAKGTVVRQHISGGYMYSGGYRNISPDGKEIELKGKVDGFLPAGPGYTYNKWCSYAKKARLLMLVNWGGKGSVTEVPDIEVEIEDKK